MECSVWFGRVHLHNLSHKTRTVDHPLTCYLFQTLQDDTPTQYTNENTNNINRICFCFSTVSTTPPVGYSMTLSVVGEYMTHLSIGLDRSPHFAPLIPFGTAANIPPAFVVPVPIRSFILFVPLGCRIYLDFRSSLHCTGIRNYIPST